ncbi:4-hydroxy-tetrahydrodipicolinate synthase [Aureococcus anophagefferens]|nr:4-hydroxy-tetrahydrodipicolinate synthase [Aureococcus anophagefferens]
MRVLLALILAAQSAAFGPHATPRRLGALRPSRSSRSSTTMMARGPMPLPGGGKSLVALATPMADDGAVDLDALRALLRWHVAEGTAGVVILGTTGEASCLTNEEKEEVMAATREEIGGVLPIVVGTGTISTAATIAATKQAKLFGAPRWS